MKCCDMCERERHYLAQGYQWEEIIILGDHTCEREDAGINPPPTLDKEELVC